MHVVDQYARCIHLQECKPIILLQEMGIKEEYGLTEQGVEQAAKAG